MTPPPPKSTLFPYTTLFRSEYDEALGDFEQAQRLYHQQRRPLGVADTRFARGAIYLFRNDYEHARDEQGKAMMQVDQIGKHTSELQSRRDLVCRLLLEKKKK